MLFQLASYGFPDWGAESYQTARMAEGFLKLGIDTTVVHAHSATDLRCDDLLDAYGVKHLPKRLCLPTFGKLTGTRTYDPRSFRIKTSLLNWARSTRSNDAVFARAPGYDPLRFLLRLRTLKVLRAKTIVELHETKHHVPSLDTFIDGYVVIHTSLREHLEQHNVPAEKILVLPNGVSLEIYEQAHQLNHVALRKKLNLGTDLKVVVYSGRLSQSRNIELLIAAAERLPQKTMLVLIGEGSPDYVERLHKLTSGNKAIRLLGQLTTHQTVEWQMAADALVIPYGNRQLKAPKLSPLKIFEYLGAGKPIVAMHTNVMSDLLSDDDVAWYFEETPDALANAITQSLQRRPRNFDEVKHRLRGMSWTDRAAQVSKFIEQIQS